jgi:hypothetical protein
MGIKLAVVLTLVILLSGAVPVGAADAPHGMYTPDTIKWGNAPPNLPKGSKLAVLYGDPSKDGLFVVRVKLPANYKLPPTRIRPSGTFLVGKGDKLAPKAVKAFPAGSVVVAPANVNHLAMTKQPAVIEISAMGPLAMNYVNPADDPSKM